MIVIRNMELQTHHTYECNYASLETFPFLMEIQKMSSCQEIIQYRKSGRLAVKTKGLLYLVISIPKLTYYDDFFDKR